MTKWVLSLEWFLNEDTLDPPWPWSWGQVLYFEDRETHFHTSPRHLFQTCLHENNHIQTCQFKFNQPKSFTFCSLNALTIRSIHQLFKFPPTLQFVINSYSTTLWKRWWWCKNSIWAGLKMLPSPSCVQSCKNMFRKISTSVFCPKN